MISSRDNLFLVLVLTFWKDKKLTVGLQIETIALSENNQPCRGWDKVPDRFSRGAIFQIYPIERHAETVKKLPEFCVFVNQRFTKF